MCGSDSLNETAIPKRFANRGGTDYFNGLTLFAHLNQPGSLTGNTNEAGWVEFAHMVFHRFAFRVCIPIHAATDKSE